MGSNSSQVLDELLPIETIPRQLTVGDHVPCEETQDEIKELPNGDELFS